MIERFIQKMYLLILRIILFAMKMIDHSFNSVSLALSPDKDEITAGKRILFNVYNFFDNDIVWVRPIFSKKSACKTQLLMEVR